MTSAFRVKAKVLPGHRIEVCDPELPDGHDVEVIILLQDKSLEPVEGRTRYPEILQMEYNGLIQKKLDRTLSEHEAERLQEVRDEIAAIDSCYPDVRAAQAHEFAVELRQIRAELESVANTETR